MNDVKLAGHIGNDLSLRYSSDRTPMVQIRLAVRNVRAGDPDWFDVIVWGRAAEHLAARGSKGDHIILTDAHLRPDIVGCTEMCHPTVTIHACRFEFGERMS